MKRISKLEIKDENEADVIVLSDAEQRIFEEYVRSMSLSLKRGELQGLYGLFLLKTGLRVGELCACQWKDYNEETGILTINKSRAVVKDRTGGVVKDNKYIQIEKTTKNQKAHKIELFDDAKAAIELIRQYSKWTKKQDYIAATRMGTPNTDIIVNEINNFVYYTKLMHTIAIGWASSMPRNRRKVNELNSFTIILSTV